MELCDETVVFKDPRMGFFASLIAEYLDDSIALIRPKLQSLLIFSANML